MLTIIILSIVAILALNAAMAAAAVVVRIGARHRSFSEAAVAARWTPRIHALLAGETSAATLRHLIRPGDRVHLTRLLAEFGQRVSGAELERLRSLGRPLIDCLVPHLTDRHPEARASATQTIGIIGGDEYASVIVEMLDDRSPLVAMVAATWLTQAGDPELSRVVLAALERFELWSPTFLASMLSEGGASMVDHLRKALGSSDAPARTRGVAADALRLLRDPASADEAAAVLERGTDREVAAACLRLLEVLGTANHAPTVRRFVHDDDFVLRALAVTALGALGTGDDDARLLDEALDDPSPWVALHAARALHNADRLDILRRAAASRRPGADAAGEILLGATA